MDIERWHAWATAGAIVIRRGEEYERDFGCVEHRVPALVLAPCNEQQVVACASRLRDEQTPYVFRGMGHSSGGQPLIGGGVVLDLTGLAGVIEHDDATGDVTVRGGTSWLDVCEALATRGRRPLVLTDNLRTTVGGTVAVGGFGDTTHRLGLQAGSVRRLALVTPQGVLHELDAAAELAQYSLGGCGQLGALTRITLRTFVAPTVLTIRRLAYKTLGQFVRDAIMIAALNTFTFLRARVFWNDPLSVRVLVGNFGTLEEPGSLFLRPDEWTEPGHVDLLATSRTDPSASWDAACPAAELIIPLSNGLAVWDRVNDLLTEHGVLPYLSRGASIALVPRQELPLLPVPDEPQSLMVALRPLVPYADAARVADAMRLIAEQAVDAGARLYMMSVLPDRKVIRRQFGTHWKRWSELKREHDPMGLCNPGLFA